MSDNTVEKVKETIVQDTKTEGDNDALATLRDLDVTGKIKGFVKEIQKVDDDEGTPLRKTFASARMSLNDFAVQTKQSILSAKDAVASQIKEITPDLSWLGVEFGSAEQFGTKHRGLAIATVGLVVAIPSALGGKRRAIVNGLLAGGATAGALSFFDFWDRRMKRREKEAASMITSSTQTDSKK